jgi:hypothetical protein
LSFSPSLDTYLRIFGWRSVGEISMLAGCMHKVDNNVPVVRQQLVKIMDVRELILKKAKFYFYVNHEHTQPMLLPDET